MLDTDDTTSGPETVTIKSNAVDNYKIFVRNYNKVVPIMNTDAQIDIYRDNSLVYTAKVPIIPGSESLNMGCWKLYYKGISFILINLFNN